MILDATVGGAAANSYMTVDEFFAYLSTKPYATQRPTEEQCPALLIEGTRLIDNALSPMSDRFAWARGQKVLLGWTGMAATDTQALCWPRAGMLTRNGFPLPPDVVPLDLKECLGEVAYTLSAVNLLVDDEIIRRGVQSVKAGSVSVSLHKPGSKGTTGDVVEPVLRLPDAAYLALVPSWYQVPVSQGFEFALVPHSTPGGRLW